MAYISFNSGTQEKLNNTALVDGLIYFNTDAQSIVVVNTEDNALKPYYYNNFIINDKNFNGINDGNSTYSIDAIKSLFIPISKLSEYCATTYINNVVGQNTSNISITNQIQDIYNGSIFKLDDSDYTVTVEEVYIEWSGEYDIVQTITIDASKLNANTKFIVVVGNTINQDEGIVDYNNIHEFMSIYNLESNDGMGFRYDSTTNTYIKESGLEAMDEEQIYSIFVI